METVEDWRQIAEFPDYSVSDQGRIRSDRFDRLLVPTTNQDGILQVVLRRGKERANRSVVLLVANSFVHNPYLPAYSNTPIHLNGDRTDCRAVNLMWRSRSFAMRFHRQFETGSMRRFGPYRNARTQEDYGMMVDIVMKYGVHYIDVLNAIENEVMPSFMDVILEEY